MSLTVQPLLQTRIAANKFNLNQVNNKQNKPEITMKGEYVSESEAAFHGVIDFAKNQKDVAGFWVAGLGAALVGVQKMWSDKFQDMYPLTPGFWGITFVLGGLVFQSLWNRHIRH